MSVPPSLADDALHDVWSLVRARLEAQGVDNRGRVRLPPLASRAQLALTSVLDRRPTTMLDLAALERGLVRLGVGDDLADALGALGFPVSLDPARRRSERRAAADARAAARAAAAAWPEPWSPQWIDDVVRAGTLRGLDAAAALSLLASVRNVLDHVGAGGGAADGLLLSRADLAATVVGSAHALDTGTPLEVACAKAIDLARRGSNTARPGADAWERAGVHTDLVAAPALTWALPAAAGFPLAPVVEHATLLGIPLHLSQLALRRHPIAVPPGTVVLVAENPRVVEAAAQRQVPQPVISTNGNPSGAVRLLIQQLLDSGATLRYHGDFDTSGLAICARMHALGLVPWRMDAADYQAALATATAAGVDLPLDPNPPGPTPWDPALRATFDAHRRIIHEERLLAELFG